MTIASALALAREVLEEIERPAVVVYTIMDDPEGVLTSWRVGSVGDEIFHADPAHEQGPQFIERLKRIAVERGEACVFVGDGDGSGSLDALRAPADQRTVEIGDD
jgi:hypothetical protein